MSTTASSGLKKVSQRRAIEVSLQNEQITRERVRHLEHLTSLHEQWIAHFFSDFRGRGFWGRFKWLVTGK